MPIDDLLFLHPLLGTNAGWSGYLVEAAVGASAAEQALFGLCQHPVVAEFDQRHPWLIPALPGLAGKCTFGNAVYLFDSPLSETLQTVEAELRRARRKVGLRTSPGEKLPMTGTWDYLSISASQARAAVPMRTK